MDFVDKENKQKENEQTDWSLELLRNKKKIKSLSQNIVEVVAHPFWFGLTAGSESEVHCLKAALSVLVQVVRDEAERGVHQLSSRDHHFPQPPHNKNTDRFRQHSSTKQV